MMGLVYYFACWLMSTLEPYYLIMSYVMYDCVKCVSFMLLLALDALLMSFCEGHLIFVPLCWFPQ
jgi:hypothetical protein